MALLRILPILAISLTPSISPIPLHATEPPPESQADLRRYAADTWKSFEAMTGPIGLPTDGLRRTGDGAWSPAGFTSPTDIGAYLWSVVAAENLGLIGVPEADL